MYQVDLNGQLIKKSDGAAKDANIRNSIAAEPQIVNGRSPLFLDNLLPAGRFNRLHANIWDAANSKIYPKSLGEIYLARVSMAVTSSAPVVITIDLDVNGVIIYKKSFQPTAWDNDLNVETFPFFAGASMLQHGASLNVDSSARCELRNCSLYLVRMGNG